MRANYTSTDFALYKEKLMHVTHHIPKIEKGEFEFGKSGGTLQMWADWLPKENGLHPGEVWQNIKQALGIFMIGAAYEVCNEQGILSTSPANSIDSTTSSVKIDCSSKDLQGNAVKCSGKIRDGIRENQNLKQACRSHGFHFVADMIVDSNGHAWIMEVHFTMGVKAWGLGDPEAGYDELLTRSTRQGVFGALSMGWARLMDLRYRLFVEGTTERDKNLKLFNVSTTDYDALMDMLVEERMRCRFDVESILPRMWKSFTSDKSASLESPLDEKNLHLYHIFDRYSRYFRGFRRSEPCKVFNFTRSNVWDSKHIAAF